MTAAEEGGRPAAGLCLHFGSCGGCAAQDKPPAEYAAWKQGFVEAALRRAGVAAEVAPMQGVAAAGRRRARLFAAREGDKVALGFRARGSHRVVDMAECRVLTPALFAALAPLRSFLAAQLAPGEAGIAELQEVSGALDVLLRLPGALDLACREALVDFARAAGIARLSWQALAPPPARRRGRPRRGRRGDPMEPPEVIAALAPVTARFGGIEVALPPLAFLQASAEGEALLISLVTAAVGGAVPPGGQVADLYCGAGTFSFPLAPGRRIAAYDGEPGLVEALNAAARAAGLGATVSGAVRNLARRPLRADELDGFDAVVLDPPRAGAEAQVRQLAASNVPLVVMVSCDPASFARDAKILMDGGFSPGPVQPVDQFVWTRHLELVGVFSR